jgi:hypothetical protein
MRTPDPYASSVIHLRRTGLKLLALLTFVGLSAVCQAQQSATDPSGPSRKADRNTANPPAPPSDALPSGDPKSGVLKPPDVDPKMSKKVPDVDPAMDDPPAGKAPAPPAADPPKVQPR